MPTLSDYQSHPDWAKLTPEQKLKVADITFDKSYAKHPDWKKMSEAQHQEARLSYYKQNSIEPPNLFNQAVGEFFQSAGNKFAEQATGGIVDTQEGKSDLGNFTGALAGGFANVGTGALIGAGIGSVVPVVGTAVGATIGGTLGAVAGGFGQSLRERQNEGKTFAQLDAGDYGRAIVEGGINAVPVVGMGAKPITKLATGALADATLNAGANALGQQMQKGEIDGAEVLQQGAFGAGGHLAGGIINKFFQKRAMKAEAQAQAQEALQGIDASQVGVLPQDGTPNVRTDLTDVFPYQEDAPFDVQGFNQDRTAQIQTDLQAKIQEAVALKAQGSHNEAKLIRSSLSKQMNTLAKNNDPLARDYAKALDQMDNQAKALKQGKPTQDVQTQDSFDPNTAQVGETRIDPNTGETVYYGGKITNEDDAPDPFFIEELQRREKVNTLEPIGTPVKPKILKGDFEKVTIKDIEDVLGDQLAPSSNVGQSYAVDTLKSLGYKVDKLKASAKGVDSRAGENYRVKVAGKNIIFKGQDPFATVTNRLGKEHGINISSSIARRMAKDKNFDTLNELVLMNDDNLDPQYSEGQGTASQAFQAFQQKLSDNQGAEMDYATGKDFAIQEAKTQELLNDLDKAHTPQHLAEIEQRYQDVLNNSIYPEYTQEIITPKLEEAQVLVEGFTPLNKGKQEQLRARLERDLNQAQTPEDIARVADELYSDSTSKALVDEASFYEPLGAKLQEAEARVNDPNPSVTARNVDDLTKVGKEYFGLNDEQAKAQAVVSDLIIQKIAERKGVSVKDAYDSIGFKKSNATDVGEGAMFQDGKNLKIGDITNVGKVEEVYGNQIKANGNWYAQQLVKKTNIEPLEQIQIRNTQERIKAGKELSKLTGATLNKNGTITLYHGTSKTNASLIEKQGFKEGSYFSINKKGTNFGDSPLDVATRKFGKDAVVIEIDADPRFLESAAAGSEIFSPERLIKNSKGFFTKDVSDIRYQSQKGAMETLENGKSVIHALTDPDVSTPLHEIAHVYEGVLTDSERTAILDWAGHKDWQTDTSERFARGFEKYLSEGKAPNKSLQGVFDNFKTWLLDIYKGITGSDIDLQLNTKMRAIYDEMLSPSTKPKEPIPLEKGGTATSQSGAGSPQARLDGKAQELGYQHIKHLMQGYKAIGGDLTPAKLKAVLEAKPELQAVADSFKPLTGKNHPDGTPKYAEEIEFQEAMREIARTPERYLDYESGTGRQQSVKQLQEKNPEGYLSGQDLKKTTAWDLASPSVKKRVELLDRLIQQKKTADADIATEGGMSGKGGATNAIDGKKRQNITPQSFALHNGQIAVNAYNADGHFAKYYIDLDPRLVKEGKEASRFLSDPVESTAPEFVGTYPNVYRDAIPFLLEDVLNRKPREAGILTSQARDVLDTARTFKSKLSKEQQLQIKYGANIKDIKKIQHELMKLNAPESVKTLTDAILNKAGNKKKLTANDIIAIKKTLEKEPTLKALKGMCDLFKLSTANLE
jgi:hypothetical protein